MASMSSNQSDDLSDREMFRTLQMGFIIAMSPLFLQDRDW